MKIISWNVNGLRAVHKKGFLSWLKKSNADIVCLQETKLQEEQIPKELVNPPGYQSYFSFAKKKGYSGVAIYTKKKPISVKNKIGFKKFDDEGRVLEIKYPKFVLVNLYIPHGSRDKSKLTYKLKSYDILLKYIKKYGDQNLILIGDFNIAHQEVDLARPKQNRNNVMFTPEEREKMDQLINLGFVDTFRKFNQKGENYTWWPYFANARERNLGWRIDYTFASTGIDKQIKNAFILNKTPGSDHCPVGIEINI